MPTLNIPAADRRELRSLAHHLDPVVIVGQKGLTPSVLHEIDNALAAHELIKVRVFSDERETRNEMFVNICETLSCAPVQQLGKLLLLFRPGKNTETKAPKKKEIERPRHTDFAKPAARTRGLQETRPPRDSQDEAPRRRRSGADDDAWSDLPPHVRQRIDPNFNPDAERFTRAPRAEVAEKRPNFRKPSASYDPVASAERRARAKPAAGGAKTKFSERAPAKKTYGAKTAQNSDFENKRPPLVSDDAAPRRFREKASAPFSKSDVADRKPRTAQKPYGAPSARNSDFENAKPPRATDDAAPRRFRQKTPESFTERKPRDGQKTYGAKTGQFSDFGNSERAPASRRRLNTDDTTSASTTAKTEEKRFRWKDRDPNFTPERKPRPTTRTQPKVNKRGAARDPKEVARQTRRRLRDSE